MVELRFKPRAFWSKAYALERLATSLCVHTLGGEVVPSEGTAQAKVEGHKETGILFYFF